MATISLDFDSPDLPTAVALTGLVRNDTGESVTLPSPADFADQGDGVWSIDFDEPAPGLTYTYTATATWDDASESTFEGTVTGDGDSGYVGEFTTEQKCELFIKTINMNVLNDVDNDGVRDAGSAQQAIDSSAAKVKLRTGYVTGGDYTLTANDLVLFEAWNRILAVIEMYHKRLTEGNNEELKTLRDEVYEEMAVWRAEREEEDDDTDEAGEWSMVEFERTPVITEDEYASDE